MTAIIGVLNSQGVVIAADSAVTVTAGNIKKVYNKSNKIFTLSKYHPVGIAIYNSSQFMGIPWETLIKMYRKQLEKKKFDTIEKYKTDFLTFLAKNLSYISSEFKENNFYTFCSGDFNSLKTKILDQISNNNITTSGMSDQDASDHISPIISQEIKDYRDQIDAMAKNSLVRFSLAEYIAEHGKQLDETIKVLEDEIKAKFALFALTSVDKDLIREMLYGLVKVDYIFESSSGLIFMGFGEKEIYPSSQQVTIGNVIKDVIRYKIHDPVNIIPGKFNADIISYAQRDVTMTVLKGIDPAFQSEINSSLTEAFNTLSEEVALKITDATEASATSAAIKTIPTTLIDKLENYRQKTITQPLLDILNYMGKEDMAELAESLVSITSLKRKFTQNSSDESVGGPVDVAVITKGDGFIWLKRKNYFDIELNRGFIDKYYNS